MFWLFLLLLASCQNHGKKLESRHRCLSRRNRRKIWKSCMRPLKGQNRQYGCTSACAWSKQSCQQGSRMLALWSCCESQCTWQLLTCGERARRHEDWSANEVVPRGKLRWAMLALWFGLCRERSSKSYNVVNRYNIVKEKCSNIVTENFGDLQP